MHVELVRTVTRDGLRLDGALRRLQGASEDHAARAASAAILLHGVAGNFYTSSTFEPLIPQLNERGIAVSRSTRVVMIRSLSASLGMVRRRLGAAYEIVDECRHDVAAWIELLKSRGHHSIVLIGHSLARSKPSMPSRTRSFRKSPR